METHDKHASTTTAAGNFKYLAKIAQACRNLISYWKVVAARRKRRKKEKDEDPNIYPLF